MSLWLEFESPNPMTDPCCEDLSGVLEVTDDGVEGACGCLILRRQQQQHKMSRMTTTKRKPPAAAPIIMARLDSSFCPPGIPTWKCKGIEIVLAMN